MMNFHAIIAWAMLAMSANAHALEPKIEIFEQYDNLRVVAFINPQDIEVSPEWDPDLAPPPLTVSDAVREVRKLNQAGVIKEIEIREVPKYVKKWHYLIKIANDAMKSKYEIYVVLMNGKVIPAIIEPQGYK